MKKQVSIARALKEKNRVAGRLKQLRDQVMHDNSMDKKIPRSIDVLAVYAQSKDMKNRLIEIKSAIAVANQGIVSKIIELDEIKGEIAYLNGLNVKEGKFANPYKENSETEIEAVIKRAGVIEEINALQKKAEDLQDKIDEFNAVTKVEIEID